MHIHYLQHAAFEGLGSLESEFTARGFTLTSTQLHLNEPLPNVSSFDWLIVMGGPMSVHETTTFPWLTGEQALIKMAINSNKKVLGICLGAQLIAAALGAKVYPNPTKEIGWFPITPTEAGKASPWSTIIANPPNAFHWHGDTFDIPLGATHLLQSEACKHQAFSIDKQVLALQFHLETTPNLARDLLKHCSSELDNGPWVQSKNEIRAIGLQFDAINKVMKEIIEQMICV